ncbi:hypothetical protein [Chitinophaga sp. MM2321]|uniref:hypothetical protein n=1 Tax=Chitinophaga sp. MM2321 TaxID=3137178 RepID=UPI0032D58110
MPEKRTSLNLTPTEPVCLHDGTEISFDLIFTPHLETYFGYIMRLITTDHQNIDLVYNQRSGYFNFVIGETFSGVFKVDTTKLFGEWNQFRIKFDEGQHEVSFYLNNQFICKGKAKISKGTCCKIYFGTNSYEGFQTLDIPPMSIRDIRIKAGGKLQYYYPLSESQGTESQDQIGKRTAKVKNPVWIKPRHQNWEHVRSLSIAGTPSVAFDKSREILYITAADSLYALSFSDLQLKGTALSKGHHILPAGNQSVYDGGAHQLRNFYIDEQKVSTYDAAARKWDVNFSSVELTEWWHANKFISPADSSLYIFGGYGQLRYKDTVQRYHFPTGKWEIVTTTGDKFMPRYMAALGTNAAADTAYIIGGYGSSTGNQAINPRFSYELLAFSVKDKSFKHIYHLQEPVRQFCFANSLITVPGTDDFYALIYPTDKFNSALQLIKGSLHSPVYQLTGDSIPYSFHDIKSFADLYYCPVSRKLVATTQFCSKDSITSLQVYTIDFPPNELVLTAVAVPYNGRFWGYLLLAVCLVGVVILVVRYRRRPVSVVPVEVAAATVEHDLPYDLEDHRELSAIFLFGPFEVFDKDGNDITKLFTPLLKELFLVLLIFSLKDGKGIPSEQLYEILWGDKSLKDARNNFSVNVVKLKAILQKVGDVHIGRESGRWKLEVLHDTIRIDYQQYLALTPDTDKAAVTALLSIIRRGAFLGTVQYEWLDDIKSDIAGPVIDQLLKYMSAADLGRDPEFIIRLANCIFFFDKLNEEALMYKSRCLILLRKHGLAKDAYLKFAKEYKESYGQDFERSFQEMT